MKKHPTSFDLRWYPDPRMSLRDVVDVFCDGPLIQFFQESNPVNVSLGDGTNTAFELTDINNKLQGLIDPEAAFPLLLSINSEICESTLVGVPIEGRLLMSMSLRLRHINRESRNVSNDSDLTDMFISYCQRCRALYGYIKIMRFIEKESWSNNHDPITGPGRLEWLNWFDYSYKDVLQTGEVGVIPLVVLRYDGNAAFVVKTAEKSNEYLGYACFLRRFAWRLRMDRSLFSSEQSRLAASLSLFCGIRLPKQKPALFRPAVFNE